MGCTVIIIGHKTSNRFAPETFAAPSRSQLLATIDACSPGCVVTQSLAMLPDAQAKDGYRMAFDASPEAKPAEVYVLRFQAETAAKAWLKGLNRRQLVGKTVLLLDPDRAPGPVAPSGTN